MGKKSTPSFTRQAGEESSGKKNAPVWYRGFYSMISRLFANIVTVRVFSNRFELRNIDTGKQVSVASEKPFTTPRLLVGQFTEAERALKRGMKQLQEGGWFSRSPVVLIQPMEKTEGGLSQVEERILQELALGAGARRAVIWVGEVLTDQQVRDKCRRG